MYGIWKAYKVSTLVLQIQKMFILSFTNNRVVVNMGILQDDKVKISKKPMPVKFDTLYSENESVLKEFKYTPNLR